LNSKETILIAFTHEQLKRFAPVARPDLIDAIVDGADQIRKAGITTPLRLQHFLAQIATETGGLRAIEENMRYSAKRMMQVWPSRFPTLASAQPYAMNPEKLANKVYGGRLGNDKPGDGWRYRGGSMIQTTGRFNYRAAGYENNPDVLRTDPSAALKAALQYWHDRGCNAFADRDDLTGLRRAVNGGTHGLAQARNYLAKAKKIFDGSEKSLTETLPRNKVRSLQQQLYDLGYVEVGEADGWIGTKTISAIAAFQSENGLTITGTFDDDTQEQLFLVEPRIVQRASDAPEKSRILEGASKLKKFAGGAVATGVALSVETINEVAGDPIAAIEGAHGFIGKIKTFFQPFESLFGFAADNWFVLLIAGAVGIYVTAKKIEAARLEDHALGKTT
jgi:putative chitinase